MKKIHTYHLGLLVIGLGIWGVTGVPTVASAASSKPTCEMSVEAAGVSVPVRGSSPILVQSGAPLSLVWESRRATKAVDQNRHVIDLQGMATVTPTRNTRYIYTFSRGSSRTSCGVSVVVVSGSVKAQPRGVVSATPVITGRAKGVSSVVVNLTPVGTTTPLYTSKELRLRSNVWTTRVTKALPDGLYDVVVTNGGTKSLVVIATSTLQIGAVSLVSASAPLVVVVPVPLLTGGTARPGATVAVAYLQLINIGTATATLAGFTVNQTGTAPVSTIVGLTAVTDDGSARGTVGNMQTGTPFVASSAFVPLVTTLAPQAMRLVTIKAVMSPVLVPFAGTTLTLRVAGVSGTLKPHATFPLFGTVWTIGS